MGIVEAGGRRVLPNCRFYKEFEILAVRSQRRLIRINHLELNCYRVRSSLSGELLKVMLSIRPLKAIELHMSPYELSRVPPLPNDLEAIIFDSDGTLVNTTQFHLEAWKQICQETGLCFSRETFIIKAGIPGREIIRDLAQKQGIFLDVPNVYKRKKSLYIQQIRKALPNSLPISCVVNFAIEAKKTNESLRLGVSSGSSRIQVEEVLELAGIRHLFDVVVGNEDYERGKPSPDAFLTACEKLNVNPAKCWGFEDTDIGLKSITEAGLGKAIDVRLLSGYPE